MAALLISSGRGSAWYLRIVLFLTFFATLTGRLIFHHGHETVNGFNTGLALWVLNGDIGRLSALQGFDGVMVASGS